MARRRSRAPGYRERHYATACTRQTYTTLDDAIAKINARPSPLALYWLGDERARFERVLSLLQARLG